MTLRFSVSLRKKKKVPVDKINYQRGLIVGPQGLEPRTNGL